MQIRTWTAKRIGKLWLFGLLAEAAVLATLYGIGRSRTVPTEAAPPAQTDILARAEGQPPLDPRIRDSLLNALADSLGFEIQRVDGRTVIHGPPGFEQGLDGMLTKFGEGIWYATVWAASIILPIPLVLLSLTFLWLGNQWWYGKST